MFCPILGAFRSERTNLEAAQCWQAGTDIMLSLAELKSGGNMSAYWHSRKSTDCQLRCNTPNSSAQTELRYQVLLA